MIDTHCHLYSKEFLNDLEGIMERALQKGVQRFYLPAIDSESTEAMLKVENDYPERCFAMMGLHPCSVNNDYMQELQQAEAWLSKRSFAAVGEIGLDFYWDKTFILEQYIVFRKQCALALQYDLPVVIHSRNATQETISIIRELSGSGLKGIFHCFSGTLDEAREIIDEGFYLGIGGVITYKNSGLAEIITHIDLKHIVLETDAPYLAPVPFRGKRNESSYLELIALKIAECKKITLEEVVAITTDNAMHVFRGKS